MISSLLRFPQPSYGAIPGALGVLQEAAHPLPWPGDCGTGFSINKEVEADNLQEDTIVTRRLVCDFISQHGGVTQVRMTPEHTSKMLNEKYLIIKIAWSKKVTHTKMLNHLNL